MNKKPKSLIYCGDEDDRKIGRVICHREDGLIVKMEVETIEGEKDMKTELIARVCHEINKVYCESIGDFSHKDWNEISPQLKQSSVNGVKYHLSNPNATPSDSHKKWWDEKTKEGWTYGNEKSESLKTHPCCVPYDDLPSEHKTKDFLFKQCVESVGRLLDGK